MSTEEPSSGSSTEKPTNGSQHSLLYAKLEDLSIPHHLAEPISSAAERTHKRLTIVLQPRVLDTTGNSDLSYTKSWNELQSLLTFVYVQATKISQSLDRVLMDINVLFLAAHQTLADEIGDGVDTLYLIDDQDGDFAARPAFLQGVESIEFLSPGPTKASDPHISEPPHPDAPSQFRVVILGGTFDHLHAGHKILLSMAGLIASEKIIVGVTDDALLTKKSNKEVLENLATRISKVTEFLTLFRPGLQYQVVPINDVYGPTSYDPDIQALIVSKETLSGAASIESYRKEKDLPALQTFVIDVISPTSSNLDHEDAEMLKQTKMSSTFIREWIAKKKQEEAKGEAKGEEKDEVKEDTKDKANEEVKEEAKDKANEEVKDKE